MTRITNLGRKRTYIEAGFIVDEKSVSEPTIPQEAVSRMEESITREVGLPPKKKRKRTKMSKRDRKLGTDMVEAGRSDGIGEDEGGRTVSSAVGAEGESASVNHNSAKSKKKKQENSDRRQKALIASERRRKKRISEKLATTTCFACRETGHAAKDCPVTKTRQDDNTEAKAIVGICYRCGSTRHTLSRCKKPSNHENPLPFASCFVCSGKGHLASSCPQNKTKGIYPNGGCCKLCGDTSHLAKDCGLRKQSNVDGLAVLGTSREAGADEDDFHVFKRRTTEMDRGEKKEEQMRRLTRIGSGAQSSKLTSSGITPQPLIKKVVYF